jgi:hypothetical protein
MSFHNNAKQNPTKAPEIPPVQYENSQQNGDNHPSNANIWAPWPKFSKCNLLVQGLQPGTILIQYEGKHL